MVGIILAVLLSLSLGNNGNEFDDGTVRVVGNQEVYVGEVKQDFTGCLGLKEVFILSDNVEHVSQEYWDEVHYNKGN